MLSKPQRVSPKFLEFMSVFFKNKNEMKLTLLNKIIFIKRWEITAEKPNLKQARL